MRSFAAVTISTLALVGCAAGYGATARTASLRLVAHTVRGTHFFRHERVRVTFTTDTRTTRIVRTSALGSFETGLPTAYDPCSTSLTITAAGVRGDTAVLKLPQRACPPPP
jgi:hypothetical protein